MANYRADRVHGRSIVINCWGIREQGIRFHDNPHGIFKVPHLDGTKETREYEDGLLVLSQKWD